MNWDESTREALNVALNEADVVGLRLSDDSSALDVLLHVLSLPPTGPIDPDARRILRLKAPGRVRVLLRTERIGEGEHRHGPAIPLVTLEDVESFFASLSWSGSIYGWKFLDAPELTEDWPDDVSLNQTLAGGSCEHSFYWFNECGRKRDGEIESFVIEGDVWFNDLEVLRPDGTAIPIDTFNADGRRHWDAMYARDERLSVEAQRVAQEGTPKWREWVPYDD